MARQIETVILGGIVKSRPAGTGLPFRDVGLVSTCQQATETQEITLSNTRTPLTLATAAIIVSTTSGRRASEKLGIHSTILVGMASPSVAMLYYNNLRQC